jgi:ATPase subunit of ABC transporter with duplicated ATPase domains
MPAAASSSPAQELANLRSGIVVISHDRRLVGTLQGRRR